MTNVFIASTQMQYINAVEAVHAFGLRYEDCVMVAPRAMREKSGTPEEPWGETHWYSDKRDIGRLSKLAWKVLGYGNRLGRGLRARDQARNFLRFIPQDARPLRLFVGNLGDRRLRHVINASNPDDFVVIDDGAATVNAAKALSAPPPRTGVERVTDLLLGFDTTYPRRGTYFTSYDVDLPAGWERRPNTYAALRGRLKNGQGRDETLFIGGPYVEIGLIGLESYIALLQAEAAQATYPVTYVPHRQETAAVIDAVAAHVTPRLWRPSGPLEAALIGEGRVPKEIFGFYSSVLPNAHAIFGDACAIRAVRVDFPLASTPAARDIARVYDHFEEHLAGSHFAVVRARVPRVDPPRTSSPEASSL